mgnify:CR=1 FL=1
MIPRLKSLELHGYKTFASRTLFEFPGVVTAIVGPNGSGKSNIADALRWVLGEQSYSLLRGRKTEDMIFAGSEQRPRAGMASATITFSNEDGWLPIDFNEVAITRRAYRDGQNEYLLNGQKVRLKEIAELLGKSGLAERTYTIIGQGLVDAALSLKPEERRRFFEEAAGIGLYRGRREEALARLDATRRNLERVLDILSELEPRLASLEKQARRAQEYERIRADLRLLLRDWYGFHWRKAQQELLHTREVLHAQEARLEGARRRQNEAEERLGELRARVQALRSALGEWHTRSSELHARWEQVSRALAVMDERRSALLEGRHNLEHDLRRLEDEQKNRQERLEALIEERDRLQDELTEAQEQAAAARKKIQARQAERSRVEQSLREARRSLVSSETAQVQLKAHQGELANRVEALRKNKLALTGALAADDAALKQAQQRLEKQSQARQEAEAAQKAAEEALHEHRSQMTAQEARRKQLQDERSRLETERTRLAAQLEVLIQAEQSLTGLAGGAKFVLQEARRGRLRGSFQALSNWFVVPAQYETAIAAALGDWMDGVLLGPDADLTGALQALAQGDKGRAVLLPLHAARAPEPIAPPDDPDCLGNAARLVQVKAAPTANDRLEEVLRLLLGQVLVVRDRAAAQRLVAHLPPEARLATLQGEVFYGSGLIVAGQDHRAATISRPRKIQEAEAALTAAEQRLAETNACWQELEAEIAALRATERELEAAARQAGQVQARANQAHQQAVLEVEQVRQRRDFQARQLAGIDGQIQRAEQEQRQGQAEMEKNSQKISALNEQIREYNQALGRLPLDEFQAQEVHWNTAAAVAGRALKEAERRLSEHREALESARRQMEQLKQRLMSGEAALARLESEQQTARSEEQELSRAIAQLRAQIDPAEKDMEALEKTYADQQAVLVAAQQAAAVAERYVTQAQLETTRAREALESLRRRIEDDFGVVAFAYNPESAGPTPLPMEGVVEQLPDLLELSPEIEENINRQRSLLRRIGPINPEVQNEYRSVKERYDFLNNQVADLKKADADLRAVVAELDDLMRKEFRKTYDAVAQEFKQLFTRLFGGGSARLVLSNEDNPTEAGIDIEARLPGRREQGLSLLSGGERSLTAVALIFALLKVAPTPFCVMDEVDAMLDEANVGRFRDLLMELSDRTQFILVTHNRNTVQAANVIYGVTMGRDSASQVISLRLDEVGDDMVK